MHRSFSLILGLCLSLCGSAGAADITWFGPADPMNSNATWPTVNGTYTQNMGVAFTTGSSGPFSMDWVSLKLNTSGITSGSASIAIAIRNTTNPTAYSAVAGTTEYAKDTVAFTMPTTTGTAFTLNLTSTEMPNITSYAMTASTSYALIVYAPNVNIGLERHAGYANGTTNSFYTVSSGFVALDTFRNNSPNYTNTANSFPTLGISFGETVVPEPSTWALGGVAALVCAAVARRRRA